VHCENTMISQTPTAPEPAPATQQSESDAVEKATATPKEIGGRDGPEPTRYGDWEKNGRCIDF
jgi:hypothetical protein